MITDVAESSERQLTLEVIERVRKIAALRRQRTAPFVPGKTPIPYAGRVYDEAEMVNLIESGLEFWLTAGRFHRRLEAELARWYGVAHASLVNSGSSANLVAVAALTSPKWAERRLRPGDEAITVAAGFPTTVAPLLQNGIAPVFVDISMPTYNINVDFLEQARSERTKAVIVAHTLGNPIDLQRVTEFCRQHHLWLIEDNCDAAGSLYDDQKTGTFGDLATLSFYPPHHMTMGEGGAVLCKDETMQKVVDSIRDWGRDCWCPPGVDNTCGKRFGWKNGELPDGYDHKYTYSHLGYNLKVTDMQAAVGLAQLAKLDRFCAARRENWKFYREALRGLEDSLLLPESTPCSSPSWFGFMITVKPEARFGRDELVRHLESRRIQTRMLFAGNLVRQPALTQLASDCRVRGQPLPYRTVGHLPATDAVMNCSFWIGVFPGLTKEMRTFVAEEIRTFVRGKN